MEAGDDYDSGPIGFDIETGPANELFTYGKGFLRLAGYSGANGPETTTDMQTLIKTLDDAPWIYGHNIMGFDLLGLAFYHGADWEALSRKCLDTMILDRLDYPPQARDTGGSVDKYNLDAVCARREVSGKTDDLKELAKEFGGFDKIPVDDPRYLDYLRGDIGAIEELIDVLPVDSYANREHKVQSWLGRMTLNGFKVDTELNTQRIAQGEETKAAALVSLNQDWDLPLGKFRWSGRGDDKVETWEDFDSPLASLEGRKWLLEVWDAFGITSPPKTDKGRLATKAEDLRTLIQTNMLHPDLVEILNLIMTVTTIRTVYQTVDDCLIDGYVHANINMGQASGRSSVTNPGLTVFGKRGGRHIERDIFIAPEGWSVFTCDLNQIDMRAIAGMCQDPNYMSLFENGRDPHAEIALQLFGNVSFREQVKPITHGSNYGLGQGKLIKQGHDPDKVRHYFAQRLTQFPILLNWQDEQREIAKSGLLTGSHGRKMKCDPRRVYTQAPALMGQNGAAELLKDCILRLPSDLRPYPVTTVHDEVVFCAPTEDCEEIMHEVKKAFTFTWRNVPIECDLSGPGNSWGEVSAK